MKKRKKLKRKHEKEQTNEFPVSHQLYNSEIMTKLTWKSSKWERATEVTRETVNVEMNVELIISCIKSVLFESILKRSEANAVSNVLSLPCTVQLYLRICICVDTCESMKWTKFEVKKVKVISVMALLVSCANACGLTKWPERHDIIVVLEEIMIPI